MSNNENPQVVVSASNGGIPGTTRNEGELILDLSTRTLWALTSGSPTATRIGPASAGTGTVTNNEGTLALGQIVIGNGGSDEQTLGSYGTVGQILTSNGVAVAPVWATSAAALNFSDSEIPSGTVNGINTSFILAHTPVSGSLKFYRNGVRQQLGGDYTLASGTISTTSAPTAGDILLADYRF